MTSTGESNLNLTREQLEILEFVRKGHNLVITGQAGVGKSRVVRAIREDCSKRNLSWVLGWVQEAVVRIPQLLLLAFQRMQT